MENRINLPSRSPKGTQFRKMRKFDLHIHSYYSDGVNSPREIIRYAKDMGLDGIAITDHNEIKGTLEALEFQEENFLVVPGIEISSRDGHLVALGIKEIIPRDRSAEETIEKIHDLGGIAIAAHPYDFFRRGVGDLIFSLDFDAVEVENGHTLRDYKNPLSAVKEKKLPITGGSDAHCLEEMGSVFIEIPEKYKDPLEAIKNHQVEVISRISKIKILKNFVIRKYRKASKKFF